MNYSEITPYIKELAALSDASNHIVPDMYAQHDIKRGLRDINGNGVVADKKDPAAEAAANAAMAGGMGGGMY